MKYLILILIAFSLAACGPSEEEKYRVATVTCAVMKESNPFESALRAEKINEARERLGEPPFVDGDKVIRTAINYGTCDLLVLNSADYDSVTQQRINFDNLDSWRFGRTEGKVDVDGLFRIDMQIWYRGDDRVDLPYIRVAILSRFEEKILEFFVEPDDYTGTLKRHSAELSEKVRGEESLSLSFRSPESLPEDATGFRLNICYQDRHGSFECNKTYE